MADEIVVATSTTDDANSLDTFSDRQRSEWLMKGTPQPADEADSATAVEPSEAAKPESIAPAPDTGKTQESKGRAEQRKAELGNEIQELLRQRAELRAELASKKPAEKIAESAPAKPARADGKPIPPDPAKWAGTWEELEAAKIEYSEKLLDWKLGQADRDRAAAAQQTKLTESQQGYKTRAEAALAADPEYADAQEIIGKFVTSRGVSELILESEVGPEIVMHLYRLPSEEQKRVAALNPLALAREITRLEAKLAKPALAASTSTTTKRTSTAKAPPTELSGKNTASTVDDAEKALADGDTGAYIRIMNARAIRKT